MRKEDLRERLAYAILVTIIIFMFSCVMYKKLINYENWLEFAFMYSIAWGAGILIRKSLNTEEKTIAAFWVILITSFICCIVFDLPDWLNITLHIFIPFAISLSFSS